MCITHCSGLLPVESLRSAGGERHQTQQQYKHILRGYDKGHEGSERGALMESDGVAVYRMCSYPLLHPWHSSLMEAEQVSLSPRCR